MGVLVPNSRKRGRVEIPADTFDVAHFSSFVSSWSSLGRARGRGPAEAAWLLQDMMELGGRAYARPIEYVARGNAQHENVEVVLRILDWMEKAKRSSGGIGAAKKVATDVGVAMLKKLEASAGERDLHDR